MFDPNFVAEPADRSDPIAPEVYEFGEWEIHAARYMRQSVVPSIRFTDLFSFKIICVENKVGFVVPEIQGVWPMIVIRSITPIEYMISFGPIDFAGLKMPAKLCATSLDWTWFNRMAGVFFELQRREAHRFLTYKS